MVTIVADRGFGDVMLYKLLNEIDFSFVIRFKGNVSVEAPSGETKLATDFVGKGGRARRIVGAMVTSAKAKVGSVVCVKSIEMKEAWCLAVESSDITSKEAIRIY